MGLTSSKSKSHQPNHLAPPPGYGYGYGPPPNFGQGFISSNGPVFPPGFIPNYGQMPQPQLSWPTQDRPRRRKKTRRRREISFPSASNGHAQSSGQAAQIQAPPRPQLAPSNVGSLAGLSSNPTRGTARRAQTPFQRAPSVDPSDDQLTTQDPSRPPIGLGIRNPDNHDNHNLDAHAPTQTGARVPTQIYSPNPQQPTDTHQGNSEHPLAPLEPPHPSAYGPPGPRPRPLTSNPLPLPPRDLYELSPYKTLLNLPQTVPLLTSYGQNQVPKPETKKPKKGLFRAFSTKKPETKPQTEVRFIPVFVPGGVGNNSSSSDQTAPMPPPPNPPPFPGPPPNTGPSISRSHRQNIPMPAAPTPTTNAPPIYFNQDTEYAAFLNHSPHRIFHERKDYPTATHLLEAMKYLQHHPDIAEQIRVCDDIGDVYPLSAGYAKLQDPNWSASYLDIMEKVLYLKFAQNPDLRSLLTNTDNAPLIYDDPSDHYWGIGTGDGENVLGRVLERVRTRLTEGRRR